MTSKRLIHLASFSIVLVACLPDRMPPEPVEIDRPLFSTFSPEDTNAFAVPLDDPITMFFNEEMDPESFYGNFVLSSGTDTIEGAFGGSDTVVTFTPTENMQAARVYIAEVLGGIKDMNGNSMSIDPTEEQYRHTTWQYTTGEYSDGGFHRIYVSDKVEGDKLYVLGNFDVFLNEVTGVSESSEGISITPDGSRLLIVSNILEGKVAVINPSTEQVIGEIFVGTGPTEIISTDDVAYVVNRSGKTISILDLGTLTETGTISFADGFRPRHIALANDGGELYITSQASTGADKLKLKIINTSTLAEIATLDSILTGNRSAAVAVSADGEYLIIPEERSSLVTILDISTRTVSESFELPLPQNTDIAVYGDNVFISSNGGAIYRVDGITFTIADSAKVTAGVTSLDITPAGELLYAASPQDSAIFIIETHDMQIIRRPQIDGVAERIAIGALKY